MSFVKHRCAFYDTQIVKNYAEDICLKIAILHSSVFSMKASLNHIASVTNAGSCPIYRTDFLSSVMFVKCIVWA